GVRGYGPPPGELPDPLVPGRHDGPQGIGEQSTQDRRCRVSHRRTDGPATRAEPAEEGPLGQGLRLTREVSMARPDKLISDELLPAFFEERRKLDVIDSWMRWDHDKPVSAKQATREHRELAERAQTPLGSLIVTAAAQELYV